MQQKNNFFYCYIKFISIFVARICKKCALSTANDQNKPVNQYVLFYRL